MTNVQGPMTTAVEKEGRNMRALADLAVDRKRAGGSGLGFGVRGSGFGWFGAGVARPSGAESGRGEAGRARHDVAACQRHAKRAESPAQRRGEDARGHRAGWAAGGSSPRERVHE